MPSQKSARLDTIGNYDLLEKIGEGCMGVVYKATRWDSKDVVAVKVMPAEIASNPVLLKRFEQEFRITSKLDHPNIVRVLEFCRNGTSPYLVMELVEGESLGDKLDREGKLSEDDAINIILQIAHGLHRAHRQGLIHRDVKPDNILVTKDGVAKLTDLGLAKDADSGADLTRTGRGLGTPDYMAPEQFRNAKNASIRCDVYSLGATLYHMITGKVPFNEADPVKSMLRKLRNELPTARDVVRTISERTDWAIRRAMSANPDNRPDSCREFAEDLLGQSTRSGSKFDTDAPAEEESDAIWYLVFTDPDGNIRTAKGKAKALRKLVKEGQLGDANKIRASQATAGPFELLNTIREFRDLVVQPTPGPALSETSMARLSAMPAAKRKEDDGREGFKVNTQPRPEPARAAAPAAKTTDDAPADSRPFFQVGGFTSEPEIGAGGKLPQWLQILLIVACTTIVTLLANLYLVPMLTKK
ncbi:MAG: serine/threonine protein kinase [Planctomycetia bacterium]|nr:serine/threonine protein kinase [Planctomycetia bacterium]